MSLSKRRIGRKVAGVGLGAALLVLGLQGPASAAVTITGIAPPTGPPGCVTVVTGTGFKDFVPAQMAVQFINAGDASSPNPAAGFFVVSDTTLWATVPAGVDPGVSYTVRVINPANAPTGVTSTATFLGTTGVGNCAPTVTSFTPTCASAGDTVVITGTNLIRANLLGAVVAFPPYGAGQVATHTVPDVDDVTSLSVVVPSGVSDGPILVQTNVGGFVFSSANFLTPPPDCAPAGAVGHERAITLKLTKKGKASGVVSSTETPAFTACVDSVPVKIQRKTSGGWKGAGSTTTSDTGSYSVKTKGKDGKYRAVANKVEGATDADDCLRAKSATRKIG